MKIAAIYEGLLIFRIKARICHLWVNEKYTHILMSFFLAIMRAQSSFKANLFSSLENLFFYLARIQACC